MRSLLLGGLDFVQVELVLGGLDFIEVRLRDGLDDLLLHLGANDTDDEHADDQDAHRAGGQVQVACKHELQADEDEDEAQAVLQKFKRLNHVLDDKEHGPKTVHGNDTRAECNVLIRNLGDLGAHAVQRKENVSGFEAAEHHQQQCRLEPLVAAPDEHSVTLFVVGSSEAVAQDPLEALYEDSVLNFELVVIAPGSLDTAPDKEETEREANPAREPQQCGHHHEEDQSHDYSSNNAHKDRLVDLIEWRLVGLEHEVEDKQVVHGEHPLQDVTGDPLDGLLLAHTVPDDDVEEYGHDDPEENRGHVHPERVWEALQHEHVEEAEESASHSQDDPIRQRCRLEEIQALVAIMAPGVALPRKDVMLPDVLYPVLASQDIGVWAIHDKWVKVLGSSDVQNVIRHLQHLRKACISTFQRVLCLWA
eukprot:CAMPEP_0171100584 /NCGR_PEP_ID=MMETSP0766_2-20121228/53040_1 /TAXON_ID=439317 /ORGANISM="Gambierdiscus australes, Strain CAWD 149" /LENGTH=419 /DNA_ID=CAMNT_0011560437 /DNA_START=65 /DNA_END=1324 /DNA_ORIENTATION=-